MRRLILPLIRAAGLIAACGDDATTPAGDATGDASGDATGGDATGGDATGGDTGTTPDGTVTTDTGTTPDGTVTTDTGTTPDGTVTTDTGTTPDTTTNPDADQGTGTCLGILACAVECTTEQCLQTCFGEADNDEEIALFNGYLGCLESEGCIPQVPQGGQPTPEQIVESIRCEQENCIDENVACTTGGAFGAGTCTNIFACLSECPSPEDVVCQRDCFASGTEASVIAWFDLNYCLNTECYTADNFQTCAQQAVQNPPCSLKYNECTADSGAGAGAGGGGDFTPERRDMGAFFKASRQR